MRLWFSRDFNKIIWKNENKWFKESCKVADITGIIFGAFSTTFEQNKDYMLNFARFQAQSLQ